MIKGFEQVNVYVEGLGIVKKTIKVEDGKIAKICDCKDKEEHQSAGCVFQTLQRFLYPLSWLQPGRV